MTSGNDRRRALIREMGLGPVWKKRTDAPAEPGADGGQAQLASPAAEQHATRAAHAASAALAATAPGNFAESVPVFLEGQAQPAAGEGRLAASAHDARTVGKTDPSKTAPSDAEIALMDWTQLKKNVAGCVKCRLCETRTRTVFGTGDEKANWLFVGEGPGRTEDAQGEPFVGAAGKLLDNMLLSMGLRRGENAYIANVVKCRPIGDDGRDRPPSPDEANACMPYLERQIELIKPAVIVALGKPAALNLLKLPAETPVGGLRGKVHRYRGIPVIVTYHPAYVLRKLTEKSKSWSDLCLAMNTYAAAGR